MRAVSKGRYRVRIAATKEDLRKAQRLRFQAFHAQADPSGNGLDQDAFDGICHHILIEDRKTSELLCCFRMLPLASGREVSKSYSAQFYDLTSLENFEGGMVEMGRFCMRAGSNDPDILRVAWGAMTQYVDENNIELLFGCSSFQGTDAQAYEDAFAVLRDKHLAPKRWLPRVKAPKVFRFASRLRGKADPKQAMRLMPPLLKTYLMMGGWVSDHAVIDRHLNTLHVFTGVEVRAIPDSRKRWLRAVAAA